jgi:quercetin dioxygenase-like cupin family protein
MPGARPVAAANSRAKRFSVNHRASANFEKRGLRNYFEYRDLGIRRATRGKLVAHVIRARAGKAPHGKWHAHDCHAQFVYVLKGWVRFEYEGVGEVLMKAGTCFYQPPRIRHREIAHSKNLELLEVVAPAGFRTYSAAPPAARKSPARR